MAVNVTSSILEGSGTIPKSISEGSKLVLNASNNQRASTYDWDVLTLPEQSSAFLGAPMSALTTFGPLDLVGVYQVRLYINRNAIDEQMKILTFHVPGTVTIGSLQNLPSFLPGTGRVRNGSFEVGGLLDGWAAYWTITDDAEILDQHAGTSRGRCIPTNFETDGTYAMVLGDDVHNLWNFKVGETFEVYQEVDFSGVSRLKLKIKFDKS